MNEVDKITIILTLVVLIMMIAVYMIDAAYL